MKSSTQVRYALLSVSDKAGIEELAQRLRTAGYTLLSTGGTGRALGAAKIPFTPVETITGNPESFDGRMKTISFQIESAILFDRTNKKHLQEARDLNIPRIDIVVCNLYPFEQTIAKARVTTAQAIESIDVGGPTMVRSAAKNYNHVLVAVDPADYPVVADAIVSKKDSEVFRKRLAAKAFAHLSNYDALIARYFQEEPFPHGFPLPLVKSPRDIRYGDNPDQGAALYTIPGVIAPLTNLVRLAGKELSQTNLTDIDAGIRSLRLFHRRPAAVVIKHNNPCGVAMGTTPHTALARALEADSESAFGGVVVLNRPLTLAAAEIIAAFKDSGKGQMDIIAAPSMTKEAVEKLQQVRKRTGLFAFATLGPASPENILYHPVEGGMMVQTENIPVTNPNLWQVVTKKKPTPIQLRQMQFAWKCIARIRSNTVLIVDKTTPMTRGIGSGQTSRVLAARIALERAGAHARGGVLASDSFFPFPDCVELAVAAGIGAIVQQGGSINDQASIDVANKAGIPMVLTGQRLFWH